MSTLKNFKNNRFSKFEKLRFSLEAHGEASRFRLEFDSEILIAKTEQEKTNLF